MEGILTDTIGDMLTWCWLTYQLTIARCVDCHSVNMLTVIGSLLTDMHVRRYSVDTWPTLG